MHHSKYKNTGILFELLTRQVTADILSGKDESPAKDLLFKFFKEHTEMGKEYQLYNLLLTRKIKDESKADRFLNVILEQSRKLDNRKIAQEKYNLIKEIKRLYPIEDFFKSSIPNYRTLASIYKLLENQNNKIKFKVDEIFQAKTCIVESIQDKVTHKKVIDEATAMIENQPKDIRLLAYKILVENINTKYKDFDTNQKLLLREYINNINHTNSLTTYVSKKIDDIKNEVFVLKEKIDSSVVKIKLDEVMSQLNNIKISKVVKDNHVMTLMLSYELLKEIKKTLGIAQ